MSKKTIFFIIIIFHFVTATCANSTNVVSNSVKSIRNELLLLDNSGLEIKGDADLCFLSQNDYNLIRHIVISCDELFDRLLNRLLEKSINSFSSEYRSFLVDGLSKYLSLVLYDFNTNSISNLEREVYNERALKILLFLGEISLSSSEHLGREKYLENIRNSIYGLYPIFLSDSRKLGRNGDEMLLRLYNILFIDFDSFKDDKRARVLYDILSIFYSSGFNDNFNDDKLKNFFSNLSFKTLTSTLNFFVEKNKPLTEVNKTSNHSAVNFKFNYLIILSLTILVLAFISRERIFSLVFITPKLKSSVSTISNLTAEERAELRQHRQFFSLRPNEGLNSLNRKYKNYVRKFHPDVVRDNGEQFISLQEKYDRAKILMSRLEEEKLKRFSNEM